MTVELLSAWADRWQYALPAALFGFLIVLESWRPAQSVEGKRRWRWPTNVGLYLFSGWLFAVIGPTGLVVAALLAVGGPHVALFEPVGRWGGHWAVLVASCLLLDLAAYLIHRMFHAVFVLWRVHAVHHADADLDASTAVRHHPIEFVLTSFVLLTVVLVTGMSPWAPTIYALIAIVAQLWQHANLRLPARADAVFGWVLVTPRQHRAHHATDPGYFNSNFGTVLSIWDRLFNTLVAAPSGNIAFGVEPFREPRHARPDWALLLPFRMRRPR
jgi:sterol desaturase/sphingolipid hydroxylase (fatty acid hydroxylase superfamily)